MSNILEKRIVKLFNQLKLFSKVIGYLHNILHEKNRISLNTVKSQFCIKHRQKPDNEQHNIIPV